MGYLLDMEGGQSGGVEKTLCKNVQPQISIISIGEQISISIL